MNSSAGLMGLVPAGPVTVTSTVPPTFWASPGGASAVIEVGEFTTTPVAALPPKATVLPAAKFVPVTVTGVPPDAGPEAGETALTVGAPAAGGPYVNWSAVLVALVPPGPVTITSTTPDPDGASAVIEVGGFHNHARCGAAAEGDRVAGGEIRPRQP